MSVVELPAPPPSGPGPQEVAWRFAEGEAVAVMGTVNVAVARLVAAVRVLLDTDGWEGVGIQSPEHWLCWKAGVARPRAEGLVAIARRVAELPACWALFTAGRLGEDSMVRIARRVPPSRDAEVAALAPTLLIAQLDRLLRSLPEQPDGSDRPPAPVPERMLRLRDRHDGWLRGEFCLPPDEGAVFRLGVTAGRDAEFRDRNNLDDDDDRRPRRRSPGRGGPPGDVGRRAGAHGLRSRRRPRSHLPAHRPTRRTQHRGDPPRPRPPRHPGPRPARAGTGGARPGRPLPGL